MNEPSQQDDDGLGLFRGLLHGLAIQIIAVAMIVIIVLIFQGGH